jgi:hypothetical protein
MRATHAAKLRVATKVTTEPTWIERKAMIPPAAQAP